MDYLLDTNILIHIIRDSLLAKQIRANYDLFAPTQRLFISVVVEGELESLALQNSWGSANMIELQHYLMTLHVVDIKIKSIIQRYAEIDAFSQGVLRTRPLGMSARNMGKNDLWIAATASVLGIPLMTTDNDFTHLNGVFLNLIKV